MSSECDPPPQQRQPDADTEMTDQPATAAPPPPSHPTPSQPAATVNEQDATAANPPSQTEPQTQPQQPNQQQEPSPETEPQQQQEKTPTPVPEIPPPGPKASRLQALFATTAKHTLDKINKENFASCFPTVANKAPGTLEFVQRQMVERLGNLWTVRSFLWCRCLFWVWVWRFVGEMVCSGAGEVVGRLAVGTSVR
jgi:kinetochore protein NNF1